MNEQKKKRVACLYRVSTKGQVDKDDIPMQKQSCREFSERQGWEIVKELSEKGVSGYKISADKRDAIIELRREAVAGNFDVLLVYMFDRLGRKDDETPFVLRWFVEQGVEVWSVNEGQQRFDTRDDDLLNYIRFWQASGESSKTSIRVKTRLGQMVEAGEYTGGTPPYGYRQEKLGRVNKKNHELYDLVIDEQEAQVVRLIFQKYVYEGYGAQRLNRYLYEQGFRTRSGRNFTQSTIRNMLKNSTYMGVLRSGDSRSQIMPELQIVTPELFDRAQEIAASRINHHSDVPLNSRGQTLLSGIAYCGRCGAKLALTTSTCKPRKDGTRKPSIIRYSCRNHMDHPQDCDGPSGYTASRVDGMIDELVTNLLGNIGSIPEYEFVCAQQKCELSARDERLRQLQKSHKEKVRVLADFKNELAKCLRGESDFSSGMLNEIYSESKAECESLEKEISELQKEISLLRERTEAYRKNYSRALKWAEVYKDCSIDGKKMIIRQLISKVYISEGYELRIELNISYGQFEKLLSENDELSVGA